MVKLSHSWTHQDIQRVSAESLVDTRTIERALRGDPVRPGSRTRIVAAARVLRLKLPAVLLAALLAFGCSLDSESSRLFGSGGAAGAAVDSAAGGVAGSVSLGGGAGPGGSNTGGVSGSPPVDSGTTTCSDGEKRPCACIGIEGSERCTGGTWEVCKEVLGGLCCSQPGEWLGCWGSGCLVCQQDIAAFPHYMEHHPACVITDCAPSARGACNSACPMPTAADQ